VSQGLLDADSDGGSCRPAIIAHGGGNSTERVMSYREISADYLEVDLWVHHGRFEARHERRVRYTPILFEKWYLRRIGAHYGLVEMLEAAADTDAGIFLDIKNGGAQAAEILRATVEEVSGAPPRIVASSQQWKALRAIRELCPEVDAFYSIDVAAKLDLFLAVSERDERPRGISCRHTLLTRDVVRRLHERGLLVVAWTVDDIERARELASWGVDGLTTHKVAEFATEFVAAP
jgi:glycerophosphoryl diester phosphodiesterase